MSEDTFMEEVPAKAKKPAKVSVPDDTVEDELVAQASVPNLASLFKDAQDQGLIKPGFEYGGSTTTA